MGDVAGDRELFDALFRDYNAAYDADPYYLTEPYPGIMELLHDLREQGITLAVLSNKPNTAVRLAAEYFFPGVFTAVSGAKEGVPLKPDPTALLNMLSTLGFTPDETAYIGDSEPDVLTAKNAEVALSVFVTYGFRTKEQLALAGATEMIDRIDELLGYINR
jgi:phosphoglycolate phosphatase